MIKKIVIFGVMAFATYWGLSFFINPARPYVDPPFTAVELTDDFLADKNISADLKALTKFYEGESDRFIRTMNLLVASDKTKLSTQQVSQRYGEVSEELKSIAARLSELHPNTRQVDGLHQRFINTLKQIASDGQELKLLFISVSRDLEEVEAILALPKSAIAENRSRLLNIRDRLIRAEAEIENKLEALKRNQRNAMEALDGLETLASKHGASLSK